MTNNNEAQKVCEKFTRQRKMSVVERHAGDLEQFNSICNPKQEQQGVFQQYS